MKLAATTSTFLPSTRRRSGRTTPVWAALARIVGDDLGIGDVDEDPVDVPADLLDRRLAHADERHLVGLVEGEGHVPVAELLVHEPGRDAALVFLPDAAHLDLAELGVVERLPLEELVPELEVLVEEVARQARGDGARGIGLLLLERRAGEVLLAAPELVRERQDAQAVVGPVDDPAVHRVEPAPDDEVAVEGQDALAVPAELVVGADVGHRVLARRLGARPAEDHAAAVVVGLDAGDVGVGHEEIVDRPGSRAAGRGSPWPRSGRSSAASRSPQFRFWS